MLTLRLSRNSPLNTTLLNEDQKPMYTISTPRRIFRRTTFVVRHAFDANGRPTQEMARIHWHHLTSSKLVFNGQIRDIDKVMPRTGIQRSRVLTAPNGKKYKWKTTLSGLQLELMEGPKSARQIVMKMRRRGFKDIVTGTNPALEIEDSALPLLDLIVVTWIYIEQRRRDSRH